VALRDTPVNGDWILWAKDLVGHSGGYIDRWTITFTPMDPPPAEGTYHITAVRSGKCLDVAGGSTADGAEIRQWACGDQRWRLEHRGVDSYRLVAEHSGKCLYVESTGSPPTPKRCGSGLELWWLIPTAPNAYALVWQATYKCLEVVDASLADGAAIRQRGCGPGTSQRWRLDP
jgi:hypothetical protein